MINFEKFVNEGHKIINDLSREFGHPEEKEKTSIALRAVLHTLRDHITIPQSLNLLSQLPMFLKGIYVEQWKYREKPLRANSLDQFAKQVENEQNNFGETGFDWDKSTIDITKTVLNYLRRYISEGEVEDITNELPKELKELFYEHA